MKKFYSVATLYAMKPTLVLPIHISKLFLSNKRYPNVPLLEKNQTLLDKVYGAYFGFIIGDVAGAHVAYMTDKLG